jgi:hypothetical protein
MGMWIPKNNAEKQRRLVVENILLRDRFPFLHTRIVGNRLVCRGKVRPTESSRDYRVEVEYQPWVAPEVRVLEPKIEPETKLHFYRDGTLCLYDWREQPWQRTWHLADTVIPWAAEWFVFYEIYMLTGKWLGKSAVHGSGTKVVEPPPTNDEVKGRVE